MGEKLSRRDFLRLATIVSAASALVAYQVDVNNILPSETPTPISSPANPSKTPSQEGFSLHTLI